MARLVSGVITEARDRHTAFTEQQTPSGPLYRFIATYCAGMIGRLMALDSTISGIEETLSYALPLADFNAGMALGAGRTVVEVTAVDRETANPRQRYPISLISRDQRFAVNGPSTAAWEEAGILYLRGPEQSYANLGSIEVQVVRAYASDVDAQALQVPNAVMPVPDAGVGAVVDACALFMARRGSATAKFDLTAFERALTRAEGDFFDSIAQRLTGRSFFTEDVMRY